MFVECQLQILVGVVFVTYIEELSGVLIGISNADGTTVDTDVKSDTEVLRHEGGHTVVLQDHLTFEEGTLGDAGVNLLAFDDHDGLVFEEVVDEDIMNSHIFKSALYDALFEVTVEAKDLYYN